MWPHRAPSCQSYQAWAVVAGEILLTDLNQPPEGILWKQKHTMSGNVFLQHGGNT